MENASSTIVLANIVFAELTENVEIGNTTRLFGLFFTKYMFISCVVSYSNDPHLPGQGTGGQKFVLATGILG